MTKANDLTQGKVTQLVLKFYFPMLLTNMLQQMYNIVDTVIVGKGSEITHLRLSEICHR